MNDAPARTTDGAAAPAATAASPLAPSETNSGQPAAAASANGNPQRPRAHNQKRRRRGPRKPALNGATAPTPGTPNDKAASKPGTKPNFKKNRLRRGVGLVVINHQGQVLAGLRAHSHGAPAWQLPQGGIEGRERPLTAAYRELQEETGLTQAEVELLHEFPRWTKYFLPREWQGGKRFIGQTQRWYLLRYKGAPELPELPDIARAEHKEFTALQWADVNWLIGHVIAFRQPIYRQVFHHFAPYLSPTLPPPPAE